MKQRLMALAAKIDALSLRERVLVFAAASAAILFVVYSLMLGPLFDKEKALRAELAQIRNNASGIDGEITARVQAFSIDPDAYNRAKLAKLTGEIGTLGNQLGALERGLVAPEKIAPLLDSLLAANGRLALVSMKTLPVSPVAEASYRSSARAPEAEPIALLYRHGVQVTVRGNYLDMVNYMESLEAMPTQLFWSSAALEVEEYPNSRLTLTLHTLSLDRKWIKL